MCRAVSVDEKSYPRGNGTPSKSVVALELFELSTRKRYTEATRKRYTTTFSKNPFLPVVGKAHLWTSDRRHSRLKRALPQGQGWTHKPPGIRSRAIHLQSHPPERKRAWKKGLRGKDACLCPLNLTPDAQDGSWMRRSRFWLRRGRAEAFRAILSLPDAKSCSGVPASRPPSAQFTQS